jgi:cytoskeletal protein CcmA (bactofilin family)
MGQLSSYLHTITRENVMPEVASQDFSTVLGPDVQFKGTLTFEKNLCIHGKIEGTVTSSGVLHVARDGKVQAEVQAGSIIIEGDVRGPMTASDRIELKQTAHCEGDLRAARLVVDAGAVFSGHVTVGPEAVSKQQPKPQVQVMRPVLAAATKNAEPQPVR